MMQNSKFLALIKNGQNKMKFLSPWMSLSTNKNQYCSEVPSFDTRPYKLHKLTEGPASSVICRRDESLKIYRQMQLIRRLEAAAGNLYKEKAVRGFCHLCSGQEAICVGMADAMRSQDSLITAYRDHGWSYVMGIPIRSVIGELLGKSTGCSRGKGGSMHMYGRNFYGGNGIVGAQVPVGTGIAMAHQYNGDGGVCIALYGDGAANQGQVFESYNIAKLWNLPIIFVCENNGFGMGTSSDRASASSTYYTRGDYVPGLWVDGMDVLTVKEATRFAINHCTSGKGPIVIEAATYRYSGHSMSDPGTSYRTREEVQEVRQTKDPIMQFKERIITSGLVTADELKVIDTEVRKEIDQAVKSAKSDKEIPLQELTTDVYSNPLESHIRGVSPYNPLTHHRLSTPINKH